MIHLELYGDPIPLKRPRFSCANKFVRTYDAQVKEKEHFRWQLRSQFRNTPLSVPLTMDVTFFMKIPKGTSFIRKKEMICGNMHHMKRPDVDNLLKFCLDVMNGIVFVDDSQIWNISAKKIYAEKPGTLIQISVPNTRQGIKGEEKHVEQD